MESMVDRQEKNSYLTYIQVQYIQHIFHKLNAKDHEGWPEGWVPHAIPALGAKAFILSECEACGVHTIRLCALGRIL